MLLAVNHVVLAAYALIAIPSGVLGGYASANAQGRMSYRTALVEETGEAATYFQVVRSLRDINELLREEAEDKKVEEKLRFFSYHAGLGSFYTMCPEITTLGAEKNALVIAAEAMCNYGTAYTRSLKGGDMGLSAARQQLRKTVLRAHACTYHEVGITGELAKEGIFGKRGPFMEVSPKVLERREAELIVDGGEWRYIPALLGLEEGAMVPLYADLKLPPHVQEHVGEMRDLYEELDKEMRTMRVGAENGYVAFLRRAVEFVIPRTEAGAVGRLRRAVDRYTEAEYDTRYQILATLVMTFDAGEPGAMEWLGRINAQCWKDRKNRRCKAFTDTLFDLIMATRKARGPIRGWLQEEALKDAEEMYNMSGVHEAWVETHLASKHGISVYAPKGVETVIQAHGLYSTAVAMIKRGGGGMDVAQRWWLQVVVKHLRLWAPSHRKLAALLDVWAEAIGGFHATRQAKQDVVAMIKGKKKYTRMDLVQAVRDATIRLLHGVFVGPAWTEYVKQHYPFVGTAPMIRRVTA